MSLTRLHNKAESEGEFLPQPLRQPRPARQPVSSSPPSGRPVSLLQSPAQPDNSAWDTVIRPATRLALNDTTIHPLASRCRGRALGQPAERDRHCSSGCYPGRLGRRLRRGSHAAGVWECGRDGDGWWDEVEEDGYRWNSGLRPMPSLTREELDIHRRRVLIGEVAPLDGRH